MEGPFQEFRPATRSARDDGKLVSFLLTDWHGALRPARLVAHRALCGVACGQSVAARLAAATRHVPRHGSLPEAGLPGDESGPVTSLTAGDEQRIDDAHGAR